MKFDSNNRHELMNCLRKCNTGDPLRIIHRVAVLPVLLILFLTAGCSGSGPTPEPPSRPDVEETSDPDGPGVRQTGPKRYTVVVYSAQGVFDPDEITVPTGSEVTFRLKSEDVVHGLKIEGTDVELASSPPDQAEATHTFNESGRFPFTCYIYCGGGHDIMRGAVVVE